MAAGLVVPSVVSVMQWRTQRCWTSGFSRGCVSTPLVIFLRCSTLCDVSVQPSSQRGAQC
eukprot:scaffold49954_cov22-Tisochrysis_lutea.AAC.1